MPNQSFVYFIQGKITRLIKIGKTSNLIEIRLNQIQSNSPDNLTFLGGTLETAYTEEMLHKIFSGYRKHGEWFLPSKEIISFVNNRCISDTDALYYVNQQIKKGTLTYESALKLSVDELVMRSENDFLEITNNMYNVNGKSIFLDN